MALKMVCSLIGANHLQPDIWRYHSIPQRIHISSGYRLHVCLCHVNDVSSSLYQGIDLTTLLISCEPRKYWYFMRISVIKITLILCNFITIQEWRNNSTTFCFWLCGFSLAAINHLKYFFQCVLDHEKVFSKSEWNQRETKKRAYSLLVFSTRLSSKFTIHHIIILYTHSSFPLAHREYTPIVCGSLPWKHFVQPVWPWYDHRAIQCAGIDAMYTT